MGDMLSNILRQETETAQAAWELLKTLPDYKESRQQLEQASEFIRAQVGFSAYDAWESAWLECSAWEVRVYFALGLGLRGELIRGLML